MIKQARSQRYLALLRGINVGGNNTLPMRELAAICAKVGCADVQTYIQSGNVIFTAKVDAESELAGKISGLIDERFGFRVPVVLRTVEELGLAISKNPFLVPGSDEKASHVYFLQEKPSDVDITMLDTARSTPDEFAVRGREVYLKMPNGMGRTKLTNAYFDTRLKTVSTARNWNTVLKLFGMMQSGM